MVKIVGILNVNKDSFYDGGKYVSVPKALEKAQQMIDDGADIIEIGGFSTKPGSIVPSIEEELKRVLPILMELNKLGVPLSIDTTRHQIVKYVKKFSNVVYINDTSGLADEKIIDELQGTDLQYVLMHMVGTYEHMNKNVSYEKNIVEVVSEFFEEKIRLLESKGIKNIIIDPGFYFHKTQDHNMELLQKLEVFHKFGYPIYVALSRKSHLIDIKDAANDLVLIETCIAHYMAMTQGAEFIRVHDIKEAVFSRKMLESYNKDFG